MKKKLPQPNEDREKTKLGRPQALNDEDTTLKTLSGLAKIQCTTKEAAAVLGVSEPTFFAFLKRYEKAREIWDLNQQSGRASLRRMQFAAAKKGNATMQIWLGKQYLDQKDRKEVEIGNPGDFDKMSKDELREYVRREAEELGVGHRPPQDVGGSRKAREQLN